MGFIARACLNNNNKKKKKKGEKKLKNGKIKNKKSNIVVSLLSVYFTFLVLLLMNTNIYIIFNLFYTFI
jgi:hypothetical protein